MGLLRDLRSTADVWVEVPVQYSGGLLQAFTVEEARFARGLREFGPLQTLHETLAHFSVRSLRTLLVRAGLQPVEFVRSNIGVLGALARRPDAGPDPAKLDPPGMGLAADPHA